MTERYFEAYQSGEFSLIAEIMSDSLIIIDDDYSKAYSVSEYYEFFQWDSVFNPQIRISGLTEISNDVYVKVTTHSKRLAILRHSPLITNQKFSYSGGKITSIEILDYENFDFYQWKAHRDTLVEWIDKYQPELSGFIYDMTKNGAENYWKSIQLFENK